MNEAAVDKRGGGYRKWLWGGALGLMVLPAVASLFTPEMNWDETDYIVFGCMILAAGGAFELLARASGDRWYRAGAAVAVLTGFFLVWANLAVGVIGSEDEPINLIYFAFPLIAVLGASACRFRAGGVAMVLAALAGGHVVMALIAALGGFGVGNPNWPLDVIGANAVFATLWLLGAGLFRMAAARD